MWTPIPRQNPAIKRLGLIVNPVAGLGGRVGLKGSDGPEIQQQARRLGATPQAEERAAEAMQVLQTIKAGIEVLTPPTEMGEWVARRCGFEPLVLGEIRSQATTDFDTQQAAKAMQQSEVDLILFAGGDGTARDIYTAIGDSQPVLGIPAGVKIHSAAFANRPRNAGELALAFLSGRSSTLREAEVVDLDEDAYRLGSVATHLCGYLKIPYRRNLVQNQKAPTPASETARAQGIAAEVIEHMQPGWSYILGPGTTVRAVAEGLGIEKTLVGVDVVACDPGGRFRLVAADVGEARLLDCLEQAPTKIVVTPIGGQGFIFGRGNQQISPGVIQKVGRQNIVLVSLSEKLNALHGRPLLVDTGDPAVDSWLSGYHAVITGYHERVFYRVSD
jgi:predicted polyphosphate/ATP-dependent NAD kinase